MIWGEFNRLAKTRERVVMKAFFQALGTAIEELPCFVAERPAEISSRMCNVNFAVHRRGCLR